MKYIIAVLIFGLIFGFSLGFISHDRVREIYTAITEEPVAQREQWGNQLDRGVDPIQPVKALE